MKRVLFIDAGARDLGILRATVFGIWFLIILCSPLVPYAYLPKELLEPVGIFRLLFFSENFLNDFVLTKVFMVSLKGLLLTGCFCCMIGCKPFQWLAIPTVLLLFFTDGIVKGFNGFVNHAELGVLYSALVLTLFPSADGFSVSKTAPQKDSIRNYSAPIFIIAFTLCAAYTFISVHRLLRSGFVQFYNDALLMHILIHTLNYAKYGFDFGFMIIQSQFFRAVFKLGFLVVTIFESLSLFVLVNRTFRRLWVLVMAPFHILSLFTMNIFFWENLLLILVLFIIIAEKKIPEFKKQRT